MRLNPQFLVDLVTFTEETFNEKLHFCAVRRKYSKSFCFYKIYGPENLRNFDDFLLNYTSWRVCGSIVVTSENIYCKSQYF